MAISSRVRSPRAEVILAGNRVGGLKSVVVETHGYTQPNTVRFAAALGALSDWAAVVAATDGEITVRLGEFADSLEEMFLGTAVAIESDVIAGTVTVTGRDRGADLYDNPARFKAQEWKSHRVAEILASRYGMKVSAPKTGNTIGALLGADSTKTTLKGTEWELLSSLAEAEGRRVFVDRNTLYFVSDADLHAVVYALPYGSAPVREMRFTHNALLAGKVSVRVTSLNVETGEPESKTMTRRVSGTRKKELKVERAVPGLTRDGVVRRASDILNSMIRQEVTLDFKMPADNVLSLASIIRVTGTGTAYDQDYYPQEITRSWGWDEGYVMSVRATNRAPGLNDPDGEEEPEKEERDVSTLGSLVAPAGEWVDGVFFPVAEEP